MTRSRKLATLFAGVLALAPLLGTSAFAESRHRDVTSNDSGSWRGRDQNNGRFSQQQQQQQQQQRFENRGRWNNGDRGSQGRNDGAYRNDGAVQNRGAWNNDTYRNNRGDRNDGTYRNNDANRGYRNDNAYRNNESYRGYRNDGNRGGDRYDRGDRHEFRGRVDRVEHWNGGYRVWVGGYGYPLFIPAARWRLGPLSIGASIVLGGYWNPLGYYDAYDYSGPYYSTAGDLHGVVEGVDYRYGRVVVRDDISGSFVTIELRGSDPRLGAMRPGDSVDLSGRWDRAGFFEAFTVLSLQPGGYGYGNDPDGDGR